MRTAQGPVPGFSGQLSPSLKENMMGIGNRALRDTAIDQYAYELTGITLDKVRKALISKLEKTGVTDISASSLADVILLGGGIVDIIAEAIADAAHYTPSS